MEVSGQLDAAAALPPGKNPGTFFFFFHSCAVHLEFSKSFIRPTNAQLNCFKILKFTLKFTINARTCFGLTKPSSGRLQYCNFSDCRLPDNALVKPKHVRAFIVNLNP